MSNQSSSRGGKARPRPQRRQAQAMDQESVAVALDEKLVEQAGKLLKACTSSSKSAVLKRGKAVVAFAVYAEAASSVVGDETAPEDTAARLNDCPPWLEYTQSWLRDYVGQAPADREILLRTSFFNPEMQQSLNRLVFSSVQAQAETPLEYAGGLISGQVDIMA